MADFSSLNGYNVKDAKARNDIEAMKTSVVDNLSSESTNLPLSAKQGNVLNENKADKLVVNQLSNPNLLINGDFQVWQEGKSFTLDGSGIYKPKYTAELWYVWQNNAMEITKVDNGIQIDVSVEQRTQIAQVFEKKLVVGETYTLSAKINGEIHTMQIVGGTYKEEEHLCYLARSTTEAVGVCFEKGTTIIEWVKLEQGSIATPFVPRTYQEEWIDCQRYYQHYMVHLPIYYNYSSELSIALYHAFKYPMRTTPTMVTLHASGYNAYGNWLHCNRAERTDGTAIDLVARFWFNESLTTNQTGVLLTIGADARIY